MLRQVYHSYRSLVSVLIASSVLLALVGYATDQAVGLFEVSVGASAILMIYFYFLFGSGSVFFDIVFSNAITLYICFFTFFVESLFSAVDRTLLPVGFILPLAAFLLGATIHRREIKGIVTSGLEDSDAAFARSFLWLLPIAAIGIGAFVLHQGTDFSPHAANVFFLGEMGLIGLVVFFASKDFALLLMDAGIIFDDFFSSNIRLIKPAFAFFTFYSMNIVIFAAIYRIIDQLSVMPSFIIRNVARDLTFVESLYFSLVTISTLGYGDVIPATNAIRFVVGVHAILMHRKN